MRKALTSAISEGRLLFVSFWSKCGPMLDSEVPERTQPKVELQNIPNALGYNMLQWRESLNLCRLWKPSLFGSFWSKFGPMLDSEVPERIQQNDHFEPRLCYLVLGASWEKLQLPPFFKAVSFCFVLKETRPSAGTSEVSERIQRE